MPLIVRIPGRDEGRVVEEPVGVIDLGPTVLGALGIPVPSEFQGIDRLAAEVETNRALFIECPSYDSSAQKAWILGRYKYLHDPLFRTEALYDLAADPHELRNIAGTAPARATQLLSSLEEIRAEASQLRETNATLSSTDSGQREEIESLKIDNYELRAGSRYQEWITGALILTLGTLVGAFQHRNSTSRPSSRIRL